MSDTPIDTLPAFKLNGVKEITMKRLQRIWLAKCQVRNQHIEATGETIIDALNALHTRIVETTQFNPKAI